METNKLRVIQNYEKFSKEILKFENNGNNNLIERTVYEQNKQGQVSGYFNEL